MKPFRHKKPAREEILENLRKASPAALPEMPDFESPLFHEITDPLETAFKKNLELVNGKVYLCSSEQEMFIQLAQMLSAYTPGNVCCRETGLCTKLDKYGILYSECIQMHETIEAGITGCELLVAHTGSVMVSSAQQGGRQIYVYPPVHIVIAQKSQLVDYLDKAYTAIRKKYGNDLPSHIALITGPSRTADIEKTLVLGAHGPREVHVFLLCS